MRVKIIFIICLFTSIINMYSQRARDYGISFGVFKTGELNAITDVKDVQVGHYTLIDGDSIRTGATAIIPHAYNVFQNKIPAAIYLGNGFGKLTGFSQVEELGNIETPIILTNTLSVPTAANALIKYTLKNNSDVRSVNPIVGETNDGYLNNIRAQAIAEEHIYKAIANADTGKVAEGNVGAGTGTICFGYKGGIGTASRKLPKSLGGYTIGVLVQSNFGGDLKIGGYPIGQSFGNAPYLKDVLAESDGSCMIIIATDAPVDARNLKRLAKRGFLGLARTGGYASNGSGDYIIAFSNHPETLIPYNGDEKIRNSPTLTNSAMSPLFLAAAEATEEAIINSLFAANEMTGYLNRTIKPIPKKEVIQILKEHQLLNTKN